MGTTDHPLLREGLWQQRTDLMSSERHPVRCAVEIISMLISFACQSLVRGIKEAWECGQSARLGSGMTVEVSKSTIFDLEALPGHLIRRLQQVAVAIFATRFEDAKIDLTPVQFAALHTIELSPGIDQASLAGMIAYDRTTIGGVVDRLMQKGLIRREVSEKDKRARLVYLTEEGTALLREARPAVLEVQDVILKGLSAAERQTFMELLAKAAEAGNSYSRAPLLRK